MEESDSKETEKHPTKAVTSEPQEEFIEPKARSSRPEEHASDPLPGPAPNKQ